QDEGKTGRHRLLGFILAIICLILLVVVVVLGVKREYAPPCISATKSHTYVGSKVGYYSRQLTWSESQKNCSSSGGSLAIVTNQTVQVCTVTLVVVPFSSLLGYNYLHSAFCANLFLLLL
uniref:C-type lectin domain-containing protein n=1 Tax=Poecilia reticulata TaxID=8081 RepID=A0A3P9NYW5_POERE